MGSSKTSHLGRAGHLAAMAEFLLRGYNVAIPEVDVGDDIFVVDDGSGDLWRVQVKTTIPEAKNGNTTASFKFSLPQLREARRVDLTYVLAMRSDTYWTFMVIRRKRLFELRTEFEARTGKQIAGDEMVMHFVLDRGDARCWDQSFKEFIGNWDLFPELVSGPGARTAPGSSAHPETLAPPDPAPPQDQGQ